MWEEVEEEGNLEEVTHSVLEVMMVLVTHVCY